MTVMAAVGGKTFTPLDELDYFIDIFIKRDVNTVLYSGDIQYFAIDNA